jgi:hypothetical protein
MDFSREYKAPEQLLNQAIWKCVKGANSTMPAPRAHPPPTTTTEPTVTSGPRRTGRDPAEQRSCAVADAGTAVQAVLDRDGRSSCAPGHHLPRQAAWVRQTELSVQVGTLGSVVGDRSQQLAERPNIVEVRPLDLLHDLRVAAPIPCSVATFRRPNVSRVMS